MYLTWIGDCKLFLCHNRTTSPFGHWLKKSRLTIYTAFDNTDTARPTLETIRKSRQRWLCENRDEATGHHKQEGKYHILLSFICRNQKDILLCNPVDHWQVPFFIVLHQQKMISSKQVTTIFILYCSSTKIMHDEWISGSIVGLLRLRWVSTL